MLDIDDDVESKNQTRTENLSDAYVVWRGRDIRIPSKPYNAGGISVNYTPEKVLDTLDFYYRQLIKADPHPIHEALSEEKEDGHFPGLFYLALTQAISDNPNLSRRREHIQMARKHYLTKRYKNPEN